MKVAQAMVIAILLAGLVSAQAPQKAKEDNVVEILNVVGNLARMASSNRFSSTAENPDQVTRERIHRDVEQIRELEGLVTLAQICWAVRGSESAEDASYDRVFITAFWHCVKLLSDNTSDEAVMALGRLYPLTRPQAGYARWFSEALAHQKAKRSEERVRKRRP
jgi:hypothetical protein